MKDTTLRELVKKTIEQIWLDIGSIHSEGKEVTHKDLDMISDERTDTILSCIREEQESVRHEARVKAMNAMITVFKGSHCPDCIKKVKKTMKKIHDSIEVREVNL